MTKKSLRASIVGATGYTGAELVRLVLGHPSIEIAHVCGNSTEGRMLHDVIPSLRGTFNAKVEAFDADVLAKDSDVVFCALPHAASARAVDALRSRGVVVVDLSADFRFTSLSTYEQWYGAHPTPARLREAVYGLVELYRDALRTADLIAAPGCYPTASILALAPLFHARLAEATGVVVDAKSGVSGAGRSATASTHLPEAAEGVRAYKAADHRHGAEITEKLGVVAGTPVGLTFVPHLVPMIRGLSATCYARATGALTSVEQCTEVARELYAGSPSVVVLDPGEHPDTLWVRGSNKVMIAYAFDRANRAVVAMSAIDNLIKGASGQAIQATNVRFGFDESAGLAAPAVWP